MSCPSRAPSFSHSASLTRRTFGGGLVPSTPRRPQHRRHSARRACSPRRLHAPTCRSLRTRPRLPRPSGACNDCDLHSACKASTVMASQRSTSPRRNAASGPPSMPSGSGSASRSPDCVGGAPGACASSGPPGGAAAPGAPALGGGAKLGIGVVEGGLPLPGAPPCCSAPDCCPASGWRRPFSDDNIPSITTTLSCSAWPARSAAVSPRWFCRSGSAAASTRRRQRAALPRLAASMSGDVPVDRFARLGSARAANSVCSTWKGAKWKDRAAERRGASPMRFGAFTSARARRSREVVVSPRFSEPLEASRVEREGAETQRCSRVLPSMSKPETRSSMRASPPQALAFLSPSQTASASCWSMAFRNAALASSSKSAALCAPSPSLRASGASALSSKAPASPSGSPLPAASAPPPLRDFTFCFWPASSASSSLTSSPMDFAASMASASAYRYSLACCAWGCESTLALNIAVSCLSSPRDASARALGNCICHRASSGPGVPRRARRTCSAFAHFFLSSS
mmetsp:Transcript_70955/g.200281  ORF Transcript_70955/g.200281 Transcript_70955/m.200281 type:complete len:515 (-) Transcript_70955:852-2396(-)